MAIVIKSSKNHSTQELLGFMDQPGDELSDLERYTSIDDHVVQFPSASGNPEELAIRWEDENQASLTWCNHETQPQDIEYRSRIYRNK